jgi:hypothetical protein
MAVTRRGWKRSNDRRRLRQIIAARSVWGALLLFSVFTTVFVVAILPIRFHDFLYSVLFSIMSIAAVLSLEKRNKLILGLAFGVAVVEWISAHLLTNEVAILTRISRALIIFFCFHCYPVDCANRG